MIEYKGHKDKLVKFGEDGKITNKNSKNLPDFNTINSYAVNGTVHYANAFITGYKNDEGNRDGNIIIRKIKAFLNKKSA